MESGWSEGFNSLTDAQLEQLFEQEVAEYECLTDLGYEIEEAPTFQSYLDTFKSADQYYAIQSLTGLGQADMTSVIAQCPPPTWFLNLDGL